MKRERIQSSALLFRLDIMDFYAVATILYSVVDLRMVMLIILMRSPSMIIIFIGLARGSRHLNELV